MNDEVVWPGEWMRGVLEVCVLRVVSDGPTYGYAIAARLELAGLGAPKGGTLYPLLGRLEAVGWVATHWEAGDGGPGRKFYELTPEGKDRLTELRSCWQQFSTTIDTHLSPAPPRGPAPQHSGG